MDIFIKFKRKNDSDIFIRTPYIRRIFLGLGYLQNREIGPKGNRKYPIRTEPGVLRGK